MFRYSSRHSRGVRLFATHTTKTPQTVIEKVVQKYSVGLPVGKVVRAGDYVMIRPEHVMTHDNTGPVISKYVLVSVPVYCKGPGMYIFLIEGLMTN